MFLGLDFGTSAVKALLIDDSQKLIAQAQAPLKFSRPRPSWSEQNPQDWWRATTRLMKELRALKPKAFRAIKGIGLSGQQHGAVLVDRAGKVLRPCILWNDGRAQAECDELLKRLPEAMVIAGNRPLAGFTAPKLLWVKAHEPEIFAQIHKVLLPKDYIRLCLSGDYASDLSDASGTFWLDVGQRHWSEKLLAASDLELAQMPALFEGSAVTGQLSPALTESWGLDQRPLIAGGGGDNAAAACGLGAIADGDAVLSLGTSGVLFVATDCFRPNYDQAVHAFCHALPERWHQMGVILSASASLEWLSRLLKAPAPELVKALGEKLKAPSSLLFLPYLSGERTPVGDSLARGAFLGLGPEHEAKAMTQAVLEGVTFAFRQNLAALAQAGTVVPKLLATGGGSKSRLWLEMLASVLGLPIEVPADSELGGAFGAARLGLMAASGAAPEAVCTKPKLAGTILPDKSRKAAYDEAYERYLQIYPATKTIAAIKM